MSPAMRLNFSIPLNPFGINDVWYHVLFRTGLFKIPIILKNSIS